MNRQQWRDFLRQQRRQLSAAERQQQSAAIDAQLLALLALQQVHCLGSYLATSEEVPTACIHQQWQQSAQQQLALPVLHPVVANHLLFMAVDDATEWRTNRFGIAEPLWQVQQVVPMSAMQALLVPLVGFDRSGQRLGMGGGFYDRTLAAWQRGELPQLLPIGLAFDQQQVDRLPSEPWDVPLPMVITASKVWDFRR